LANEYWNYDNSICTACSTLNPYCQSCPNKNTCTSCSEGRDPEGKKCNLKPVPESKSYVRLIAELSVGFGAIILGAITWIILKIMKINSNNVRAYSGVDGSRRRSRMSLIQKIKELIDQ